MGEECKACDTTKNPKSNLSCPPQPCCLPVVPGGVSTYQVNPCQPNGEVGCGCCNVCVPVVQPDPTPCPTIKIKKRCKYIQPPRPKSYAPERKYLPPALKMADDTIYRKSFLPLEADRPGLILPDHNLCLGEGKISDHTVNRMSYLPHKVLPPCPIIPCEHKLIGEGPMQDITTQKHDYVPKPFSRPQPILPDLNLMTSDCPLSDKTVNRMSYLPHQLGDRVNPIYPTNALEKPCGKISDKTIHNMSFQAWQPPEPIEKPWAEKPKYVPPKLRMEDNTVNKMSYMPPGHYVECDPNDPDCIECPEPPCNPHSVNQHQIKSPTCCMPCCCPKAAC